MIDEAHDVGQLADVRQRLLQRRLAQPIELGHALAWAGDGHDLDDRLPFAQRLLELVDLSAHEPAHTLVRALAGLSQCLDVLAEAVDEHGRHFGQAANGRCT